MSVTFPGDEPWNVTLIKLTITKENPRMSLMKTTFEDWMKRVDREIERITGMSSGDLPDVCYRDWYDDGVSPMRAAKRAVRGVDQ